MASEVAGGGCKGWPTSTIGEVCKIVSGATPKTGNPIFWNGDIPWVTPKDLSRLGQKLLNDTPRKITEEGLRSCSAKMLPSQSILFSSRAPIGLVAINAIPVCTNQGFKSMVPRDGVILPDYLFWWLKIHRKKIEHLGRGATFKEVSKKIVENIKLPLPPLPEQKRIAKILDATDALRTKRREALAQLDTFLQSTFLEMFSDPIANNWEMVTVENVIKDGKGMIRTGPFGSQLLRSEFVDEGIPVLGIDNAVTNVFKKGAPRFITSQKYEQLRRYTVTPGDVLITIMGTCGRCAIVPDGIGVAINTKHLCCITLNQEKCLPEFMHSYFLRHLIARRYLEQNAKGAIMSGMNMGIIKALPIPLPPLPLQNQFAAIVNSVEQQKSRMKTHLTELDTLFASLQQRAFNGEL
ncbi:MAG: restriction endonuclease subunit S [Candidatus Electrothrix sp. GM3_4]|nr:restriction endonuclease subunit S [Candidatus Electrothrix sp. GM3_4]